MFKLIFKTTILSLFRRKMRTFLAIIMIGTSLWGLMAMLGIYDGMIKQMVDNAVRSDSGDITLYHKGFRRDNDIKLQIKYPEEIIKEIEQNPAIKSHVQRVLSDGLIATAKYSKGVKIFGIDLTAEKKQANLDNYLKAGVFGFGKRDRGIMIGASLAKKMKISIGNKVILSTQTSTNEINSIALKVTGILKTNNMHIDGIAVFISLQKAKNLLNIEGLMQISMIFEDKSQINTFQDKLRQTHDDFEVFRWDELYPALMQSQVLMQQYGMISYLLIFFIAGIGIFGVVLVSVLERLREFAILQAIGTPFKTISQIIFLESLFIGLMGFILGCILGGGTLYYFHIYGIDLSRFSDALDEFGMDAITYAVIKSSYFLTGFLAVLIAVLLSVIFPLRLLKKSKPIEVINE